MKNILFIILLVFGVYKLWKYLTIRHFNSTQYIKQIKEVKCECLAPASICNKRTAKHNDR